MKFVENIPLNTDTIANLISDQDDLYLVWPKAKYPFDHEQWREVLNPEIGHVPFLIYMNQLIIGHAALGKTLDEGVYSVSFLYLSPHCRSQGLGTEMIFFLEKYAKEHLEAKKLSLVVRTYNPRAHKCYLKCGFQEESREDTLIKMSKILNSSFGGV